MNSVTKKEYKNTKRGIVLLFAVLVASVILSITLTIVGVAYKGTLLSTTARDSHYAFFAADAGVECGLYYDLHDTVQSPIINSGSAIEAAIDCDGTGTQVKATPPSAAAPFIYDFKDPGAGGTFDVVNIDPLSGNSASYCAHVIISKAVPATLPDGSSITETHIDSFGYNAKCDYIAANPKSRRIVERFLSVHYQDGVITPSPCPQPGPACVVIQ